MMIFKVQLIQKSSKTFLLYIFVSFDRTQQEYA